jgi:tetratricopeptide (TPR) repeat protein
MQDFLAQYQKALALYRGGEADRAEALYRALLLRLPNHPQLLADLGTIALEKGNVAEAVQLLGQSLDIESRHPAALLNRALGLRKLGRLDEALSDCVRSLALAPTFTAALVTRGLVLHDLHRFGEALRSYDQAIAADPSLVDAHVNRGVLLQDMGEQEAAVMCFDRALGLQPDDFDALMNRAKSLAALARVPEALESYDLAAAARSDDAQLHFERGNALRSTGRSTDALAAYDHAIRLRPDWVAAFVNRGLVLQDLKKFDEALGSYDRAIMLDPEDADAHWNKALLKLVRGEWEEGWRFYEWRWKSFAKKTRRNFTQPLWLGGEVPIAGRTILVHAEQGLGDTIQFCRLLPLVERLGAKVVFEVPFQLAALMRTMRANFQLVLRGTELPPFEFQCPLLSLPLALKCGLHQSPSEVPYLFADSRRVEQWRKRLGPKRMPRIGLAWSGAAHHTNDRNRSIPVAALEELALLPFEFHVMQRDVRVQDAAFVASRREFLQIHPLEDFADTAALMEAMDLVISVDTSVAHLAGAIGRPLWVLLPYAADFRWMADQLVAPWYPGAELIRQSMPGDWSAVISEVGARLRTIWHSA